MNGEATSQPQTSLSQFMNQQQTVQSPLSQFFSSANQVQNSIPQFISQTQGQSNLTQVNWSQLPVLQANGQVIPSSTASPMIGGVPQIIQGGAMPQFVQQGVTPQIFQPGVNTPQIIQSSVLPQGAITTGAVASPGSVSQVSQAVSNSTQMASTNPPGGQAQVIQLGGNLQLQGFPGNMIQMASSAGGQQIMVHMTLCFDLI